MQIYGKSVRIITFTPTAGRPLVVSNICVEIGGFALILYQFTHNFDCTWKKTKKSNNQTISIPMSQLNCVRAHKLRPTLNCYNLFEHALIWQTISSWSLDHSLQATERKTNTKQILRRSYRSLQFSNQQFCFVAFCTAASRNTFWKGEREISASSLQTNVISRMHNFVTPGLKDKSCHVLMRECLSMAKPSKIEFKIRIPKKNSMANIKKKKMLFQHKSKITPRSSKLMILWIRLYIRFFYFFFKYSRLSRLSLVMNTFVRFIIFINYFIHSILLANRRF